MTGDLIDPAHQARDITLIRRAVRQGWDIPPETMAELPGLMLDIAKDKDEKATDRIAATKVLVVMHNQNEKQKPPRTRKVKHIHSVEPVTDANIEHRKDSATRRLADLRDIAAGGGSGGGADSGTGSGGEPG